MGLRDIGATLPPGFRFYPSDEELVCHYLYKKVTNEDILKGTLVEIDLHTCEPWELPEVAKLNSTEWYFFSFRDRKYATGYRANRATKSGYWKATGKDRSVVDPRNGGVVGMRKTLVFYKNRAPNGIKTGWIMHEFRLENPHVPPKEDWVLCRVFHKAKSEENTLQNGFDTTGGGGGATSPHYWASLSPLTHHHPFPCGHHQATSFSQSSPRHSQNPNPNPTNINLALQSPSNPSSLHAPRGTKESPINEMFSNSKCEEDPYGFLFDMGLEDGASSDIMEDMRFDAEINNSLVFL
ncbi:hypothetical protein LguiB_030720 [Lonicera macranthoides]